MLWHGRRFPGKEAAAWWEVDQKKEGECLHPPFCYVATLILHRFVLDFKRTSDTDVKRRMGWVCGAKENKTENETNIFIFV